MAHETAFTNQLLAVIVIYNTEPRESPTFKSLVKALQHDESKTDLLIYDNSPHDQLIPTSDYLTIHYVHDPSNGGVSKAYNVGWSSAKELKKEWILLLDQDDLFPETAIQSYREAVQAYPNIKIFAPVVNDEKSTISPYLMRFGGGSRINQPKPGPYKLSQYLLINSGLLLSVQSFENAGGYDENFPLDFSDLDFVLRLRISLDQFVILPVTYQHSLSINTHQPVENRLKRFKTYLNGAKLFRSKHPKASRSVLVRSFYISLRLSIQHRSIQFVKEYFTLMN